MANLQIACVHSNSEKALKTFSELGKLNDFFNAEKADVILALGGDGFLLHTIHNYLHLKKPIYGMNCGTLGFLMNENRLADLENRIEKAKQIQLTPLKMEAKMEDGSIREGLAFNEVAVTRHSGQSANLKISINGVVRLEKFSGDGIILATPAGSTAYNLSAHGPIVPLGSNLLALTPVSPFRPRRWKGALLPNDSVVTLENLDHSKRPLAASADFMELFGVHSITISQDNEKSTTLLFDPNRSLEERIIMEQFAI